ncbi:MAG: glycosyl transferase family protein [Roseobacter sp.]
MSLAPFVRVVAQGKGRARALSLNEAQQAMTLILSGDAAPEAVGALLMVLRLRGETAEEIAGFTAALRAHVATTVPKADIDWPSYAAGRTRGAPLFLLSAELVAQAGYSVCMHGINTHQRAAAQMRSLIPQVAPNIDYRPLESLSPKALDLLQLRDTFGLRSCINTVLRMWNPSGANLSVQGVFHGVYRGIQSDATALLGPQDQIVIKGGGGEFERHPAKDISLYGWRNGQPISARAQAMRDETRRLHEPDETLDLEALWRGDIRNDFARDAVIGTAALALWAVGHCPTLDETERFAATLWHKRYVTERLSA